MRIFVPQAYNDEGDCSRCGAPVDGFSYCQDCGGRFVGVIKHLWLQVFYTFMTIGRTK